MMMTTMMMTTTMMMMTMMMKMTMMMMMLLNRGKGTDGPVQVRIHACEQNYLRKNRILNDKMFQSRKEVAG